MSLYQIPLGATEIVVPPSVTRLVRLAVALGAVAHGGPLSPAEEALLAGALAGPLPSATELSAVRRAVREGHDPLGEELTLAVPIAQRRRTGAFYTPPGIVLPMVRWVLRRDPERVVDAGCGSGRFAMAVARERPDLMIVAVDSDPLATLVARANLHLAGARRFRVVQGDYTSLDLEPIRGRTGFVGNPPYVRHHQLSPEQKERAVDMARRLGLNLSRLSGLHVHFFLATALLGRPGDVGCFVTSAEWLDVHYGAALRDLLAGWLGADALHWISPESAPFEDAMTTAVITCFHIGDGSPTVRCRYIRNRGELGDLDVGGTALSRAALRRTPRWTPLFRGQGIQEDGKGLVPLGTLVRVSRGVATGANSFFVMTKEEARLRGLSRYVRPVISKAEEVLQAEGVIRDGPSRKELLDLPASLALDLPEHGRLREYLEQAERQGIPSRYLCAHRRPWWRLGAPAAPPVVGTYMARQGPAFALNVDGMAILNVIHGLYPRQPLSPGELAALVRYLNAERHSFRGAGRTYHGGLEKFEPREMEALRVPGPERLRELAEEGRGGEPA